MIIFRTDASPLIGFGHLTRCRALAQALRRQGERCVMVGPDAAHAKTADQETFEDWIPMSDWSSATEDAARLIDMAHQFGAEWLVLDDYRIDEAYQLSLRAAGLRWLQFDGGAAKALWADVVVNANPAPRLEDYTGVLRNPTARLLLGPRYALLRPEFKGVRLSDPGRPVKQILVTFGGGDDRGANQLALSSLLPVTAPDLKFLVVSGAGNPNNLNLKHWIEANGEGRVTLHIDPDLVAPFFASCELALTAGGTTTAELAALGVPFITIAIVVNQENQCKAWEHHGISLHAGSLGSEAVGERVESHLQRLLSNPQERLERSRLAIECSDGFGAERILDCLNEKV